MPSSPHVGTHNQPSGGEARLPLSRPEFVAILAAIMALNALAIDTMLPALPDIAQALHIPVANDRQQIVSLYFIGLGLGSLLHGPLADRYGRKPVVLAALSGYIVCALASGLSSSWPMLQGLRFVHGLCGAALSVVGLAMVRDCTSGDAMARLLSTIFLVFMIVPIVAPSLGSMILLFGNWRLIFLLLAGMGGLLTIWVAARLRETLPSEDRQSIRPGPLLSIWLRVASHRQSMAYMLASSLAVGANYGFLNSSEQIISETFGARALFPYAFAFVASGMALSNFFNSRIVEKFGARRVSQTALILSILLSAAQWFASGAGEGLPVFLLLIALNMSMIGFIGANFSSIAMEPFGATAGSASSFQSSVRTLISAVIGGAIGAAFDGSATPLAIAYMACGTCALLLVVWGEGGRLFTRPNPPHRPVPRV